MKSKKRKQQQKMVKTFNTSEHKDIDRRGLRKLASIVWKAFRSEKCDVSLNFVPDQEIIEINKEYLNKDYATDVISFDLGETPETGQIADIYISPEVARQNAEHYRCDFSSELARVVIHGMLHVIGYEDTTDTERNEMRLLEDKFLEKYVVKRNNYG